MTKPRTIYIECTCTWDIRRNTGIQRVVRNVVNHSLDLAEEMGVRCQPVVVRFGRFFAVKKFKPEQGLLHRLFQGLRRCYLLTRRGICRLLPFQIVERFLFAPPGKFGLTPLIRSVLTALVAPLRLLIRRTRIVEPGPGDVVVLLDASWWFDAWQPAVRARERGARLGLLVYDLIPITHRLCQDRPLPRAFVPWLRRGLDECDFLLTISKTVRDQLITLLKRRPQARVQPRHIYPFTPGCDLDLNRPTGHVRRALVDAFDSAGGDVWLSVGSITRTKNQLYTLEAFDRLWQRGVDVKLCFVGIISFEGEKIGRAIRSHAEFGRRLLLFTDLDDTELAWCYDHAFAFVFSSVVEGFGLPLIEALSRGLPTLASDIPILREVGGDWCGYMDLSDPDDLARQVEQIEATGQLPGRGDLSDFHPPDWADSARQFLAQVMQAHADAAEAPSS